MNYVEFPHLRPLYPYALLLLPRPHPRIPILVQTERRQTLVDFSQEDCPKTATRPPGIAGSAAQVHEARGRQSWQSLHSHGHAVDTVTLLGTPISFPRLTRPTPKNTRSPTHFQGLKFRSTQTQHTPPMDNTPSPPFATRHATTLATPTTVIVCAVTCSTCPGK